MPTSANFLLLIHRFSPRLEKRGGGLKKKREKEEHEKSLRPVNLPLFTLYRILGTEKGREKKKRKKGKKKRGRPAPIDHLVFHYHCVPHSLPRDERRKKGGKRESEKGRKKRERVVR